jgi:hypothetical protein
MILKYQNKLSSKNLSIQREPQLDTNLKASLATWELVRSKVKKAFSTGLALGINALLTSRL